VNKPEVSTFPETPDADSDSHAHNETSPLESEADVRVVDKRWWARDEEADGSENSSAKPSYIEDLEHKIAEKDEVIKRYAAQYKDQATEFEQARVRLRRELAKDVEREKRAVLASFLEVMDNLDRALGSAADTARSGASASDEALLKGLEIVRGQFLATLGRHGVRCFEPAGQPFDPNQHDAFSTVLVTDTSQDGIVIEVIKPGYTVGEEVLRAASVAVGKLKDTSSS